MATSQTVPRISAGPRLAAGDLAVQIRKGEPVRLDGATIEGDLDLDGAEVSHRLIFTHCVFLGHVHLAEARFAHSVNLTGCELREGINFFAARVDGQLKLPRARICLGNHKPVEHNFDQIEVRGRLDGRQLRSEVSLSLRQARLGEVSFDGLQIGGDLNLEIARVSGDVFCQALEGERSEVGGRIRMAGLEVGGHVDLCGIRITGDLDLTNAEIRGDFLCQSIHGFRPEIRGGVFGTSARISHALLLDGALIEGDLDLQRAVVNGPMICDFDEEFYAARPDAAKRDVPSPMEVRGSIDLSGAQVQELVLSGRVFDPPGQKEPSADAGSRYWKHRREFFRRLLTGRQEPAGETPRLKLDRTRLSKLTIRERIPDSLSADGMTFDDLELPHVEGECEYSELLRRNHPFKRSTYLAVESWLHNKGLEESAARVYLEMSDRDLITGHTPRLIRWLRWLFLGTTIGYGARPRRLIGLFVLVFALSCWVFSQPGALVSYTERRVGRADVLAPGTENPWITLGVALRSHFPMLLFLGEPNWVPSPKPIPHLGMRFDAYALLISAVSWVMVPLFLAGLTGIVRQRR